METKRVKENLEYHSLLINRILTVVLVSVIPMILAGGAVLYQFQTSYHEKLSAHVGTLVQEQKRYIDSFLDQKLGDIRFLAERFGFRQLSSSVSLQETLAALRNAYGPVFVDLGVIDDEGVQVAYAGPFNLKRASYKDADWFKKAMNQDYVISDVFLGLRGAPHFIIAVRGEYREKRWLLRSTIDFAAFNDLVENIRVGKTGFAFILNRDGKFQTKPLFDITPEKELYLDLLRNKGGNDFEIIEKKDETGTKNIYVASSLKNGEWMLIYQQRSSDAFADITKALKVTMIIILLGALASIGMAVVRVKAMSRRLAQAEEEKELMNRQIIETGKLASVGELAAGIAHEINNPVAIMVEEAGWIGDLLEEEDLQGCENSTEFRRAINQIQNQGRRCKQITHKLLSFARKTDARVEEVELKEVVQEILELTRQQAKFSNVAIGTHVEEDLPSIHVSPTEFQQLFLNLINNAVDAMEKTGGSIDIRCRKEGATLLIEVADDGPGIPKANLDKIFDPFFTTKKVGKGTGLGLSICYGIIKKMGEEIVVESTMVEGTTFMIRLPL
ncbi:MAG: ATP-binding protein, partial [Deltaproteobacteria bacterium]|nr:ATP-binding protein [Deltaproteobacteria bacterium]